MGAGAHPGRYDPNYTQRQFRDNIYAAQQQRAPSWPEILGVSPLADKAAIKAAFRRQALKFHPDHGGNDYQMRLIIGAYKEAMRNVR